MKRRQASEVGRIVRMEEVELKIMVGGQTGCVSEKSPIHPVLSTKRNPPTIRTVVILVNLSLSQPKGLAGTSVPPRGAGKPGNLTFVERTGSKLTDL